MSNKTNSEKCLLSSSSLYSSVSLSAWQLENILITTLLLFPPNPKFFLHGFLSSFQQHAGMSSSNQTCMRKQIFKEDFTRNFLFYFPVLWNVQQQFSFRKCYCNKRVDGLGWREEALSRSNFCGKPSVSIM